MPDLSIIIPCYNHGHFLDDALESIARFSGGFEVEVIIVNDGSTDTATLEKLRSLESSGYSIIHQANAGLAAARNTGVRAASARFILPLDADNRLVEGSVALPLAVLRSRPEVGVVYGDRQLFGEESGRITHLEFNLQRLMTGNYIDACCVFRKTLWEAIDGYDEVMPMAWTDWEFFLHAAFTGHRLHYIPEVLFEYRVINTSMVQGTRGNKRLMDATVEHIRRKHPCHFGPEYIDDDMMMKFRRSPLGFIGKLMLKRWAPRRFERMVAKGDLRRYL